MIMEYLTYATLVIYALGITGSKLVYYKPETEDNIPPELISKN